MSSFPHETRHRARQLEQSADLIDRISAGSASWRDYLEPEAFAAASPALSGPFSHGMRRPQELWRQVQPVVESLPRGECGIARPSTGLRVAIIGDPQLHDLFDSAATLLPLRPKAWRYALEEGETPDLLLITSATGRSSDGSWSGLSHRGSYMQRRVTEQIVPAFVERDIPVVYWATHPNLPNVPGHESYLPLARAADHLFTEDADHVAQLQADCPGAKTIEVMGPAVDPSRHSPIGTRPASTDLVPFGGSWHTTNYGRRRRFGLVALDGVMLSDRPLLIFDRNSRTVTRDLRHEFPRGYAAHLVDAIAPAQLSRVHRAADAAVNLNSVSGSQTQFAERAVELQACGTAVISTYNQGLNSHYPQVHIANSAQDVAALLDTTTLPELRRIQGDGIRAVFLHDHAADRMQRLAHTAGVMPAPREDRLLAVAEDRSDRLAEELAQQSTGPVDLVAWDELASRSGTYDMLLPVSADRRYAPSYAADHLAAFTYQSDAVTTKLDGTVPATDLLSHQHAVGIESLDLSAWWQPEERIISSPEVLAEAGRSAEAYRIDPLGHHPARSTATITARRPTPDRSRDQDFETVAADARETVRRLGLDLSVIVPIYNNGDHLRHKAFASLRRSSIFERMHILLVSDGATDPATVDTVEELAHDWPNVTAYHHAEGGSGSASRPRNVGLALTAADYVTYLDPDNEAVEDGYARLLKDLQEHPDVDFTIGRMSRWTRGFESLRYEKDLHQVFADHLTADGTIDLPEGAAGLLGFRPMSIQAIVARTSWLKPLELVQPLGAVGQDTYFFQQMLHYARRIRAFSFHAHTYYSVVSDSTVNTIDPSYFRKYLPLDKDRANWLREVGLLDTYKATRLERFTKTWYLKKLRSVPEEDWLEAAEHIAELLSYYGDVEWTDDDVLSFWDRLAAERDRRGTAQSTSARRDRDGE